MAQGSPSRACCTTQRMTAVTPSHFPAIEAADGFHPLPVVEYFRRLIWTGGVAGLLVGLVITVIQTVTIYPLLRAAEQYGIKQQLIELAEQCEQIAAGIEHEIRREDGSG